MILKLLSATKDAFTSCWHLALIVLVLIPIVGANASAQMKYGKGFSADAKKMYEEASQIASDAVGSIRTVASFCAEEKLVIEYIFYVMTLAAFAVSQSFAPDTGKAMSSVVSVFAILDGKPDVEIFRDLCLTIQSGKSGKSTVISLLQRFYNPDSGAITLDGVELQKFQLKWLRLLMGLVSQEPVLFNDTIRANISYGKHGQATEAEIIAASEFICGLHQGYDTVSQDTTTGQGYKSSLDAESERVVQDALDMVMVNRTTVVVAHRLSTIKGADVIVVIKNGVIVEKGKHEEFINIEEGFYTSLVALHMCSDM
ncbi:ABC transporter B family member 21-like protein [Tanacetum coccineum]